MLIRGLIWIALVLFAAAVWSCSMRQPKVPGPIVTKPEPPSPSEEQPPKTVRPAQAEFPPPPEIGAPAVADLPPAPVPPEEAMPAPPPPERRRTAAAAGVAESEKEAEGESASALTAIPKLTTVISEQARWEYNQEIDDILFRINEITRELDVQALGAERLAVLDRVRAFVRRTIDTRDSDLATALVLARRAEVLAKDLEGARR